MTPLALAESVAAAACSETRARSRVKFFAAGFMPQQLREHFVQAVEDVNKIDALATVCREGQ